MGRRHCSVIITLLISTAAAAAASRRLHSGDITSSACCHADVTGSSRPDDQQCFEEQPVIRTAGGSDQAVSPMRLMRCINDAPRPKTVRGTWEDEVASISAAGVWWSPKRSSLPITVISQLSIGRLPQLWAQCRSWTGALSAAIFVPMVDGATRMTKRQLWCAMQQAYRLYELALHDPTVCDLDIVLLYEQRHDRSAQIYYPVNVLRNIARLQARTELLALVDVDMLMSAELYRWLQTPANMDAIVRQSKAKSVFVLPAFEVHSNTTAVGAALADRFVASTKLDLLNGMRNSTLSPFAAARYPMGHNATNFQFWTRATEMYEITYAEGFEPWVMTHRTLAPWHDGRLRGYGYNKISHIAHLNASNFKFMVHPSAFIVHRAHENSLARKRFLMDKSEHFYLRYKNRTNRNEGRNSYLKVKALFQTMKEDMDVNKFQPVIDPATIHCRKLLSWWS